MKVAFVFGSAPAPDLMELFCYERGVSITGLGSYAALDSVHAQLPLGIGLTGEYFANASVETAISSGERAALRVDEVLAKQSNKFSSFA